MRARSPDKADRPTVRMPFLWYRGARYVSVAAPRDPRLREAFERGHEPWDPDVPWPPDLASWSHERQRAFRAGAYSRRSQKDLRAPVAWPLEAALLVLRIAAQFGAESVRERHGKVGEAAVGLALYGPTIIAENRLEVREADRLGLTPQTAPRNKVDLTFSAVQVVFSVGARLRGFKVVQATPPVAVAQLIIAEIERRRSWRAALAAGGQATPDSLSSP